MRLPQIPLGSSLLSATLVLAALLFAWVRSAPPAATPGPEAMIESGVSGAGVWTSRCAGCHGEGESRGRSIPGLLGFAVELFTAEGGRDYLVDFLFDGRVRQLQDGAVSFTTSHPAFDMLSNEEAAAVLNHMLISWGNAEQLPAGTSLYTAREIAARR